MVKPEAKFKTGDYVEIYSGTYEGHCFWVTKKVYDEKERKWFYDYPFYGFGYWVSERCLVPGRRREHRMARP